MRAVPCVCTLVVCAVTVAGCHHDLGVIRAAVIDAPVELAPGSTDTGVETGPDTGVEAPDAGPSGVTISGKVRLYSNTDPASFQANATVRFSSSSLQLPSLKSGADGSYSIGGIPLASALDVQIDLAQAVPAVDASASVSPLVATRLSLQLTSQATQTFDLPLVTYAWAAQVAFQCGIFASIAEAEMSMGATNPYFTQRSTIFGELDDATGTPVAGISKAAILVTLGDWANADPNPRDTDSQPTKVCFLDKGASGTYIGTPSSTSNATGRFAVFRVRDADSPDAGMFGTGKGIAKVRATGFLSQTVNLSSGNIGVVTLKQGTEPTPSFAADVFPIFSALQCYDCHTPGDGGVGFDNSQQHLDLSRDKAAADIYAELILDSVVDGAASCSTMTPTPIICLSDPDMSLLLQNPLGQNNHPGAFFADSSDPDYQTIRRWIVAGAPNN